MWRLIVRAMINLSHGQQRISNERGSYKCVRILMDSLITTAARALARVAPRQIEAGRPARSLERYADPMAVSQSSGSARELGMRT